jgi:hypothetical protein
MHLKSFYKSFCTLHLNLVELREAEERREAEEPREAEE